MTPSPVSWSPGPLSSARRRAGTAEAAAGPSFARQRAAHADEHARWEGVGAALARLEAEAEAARRQLFEAEAVLEAAQTRSFGADNEVRRLEGELLRLRDQLTAGRKRAADASRELTEVRAGVSSLGAERATLSTELEQVGASEAEEIERLKKDLDDSVKESSAWARLSGYYEGTLEVIASGYLHPTDAQSVAAGASRIDRS
jgi:chromosome segregation ATPase